MNKGHVQLLFAGFLSSIGATDRAREYARHIVDEERLNRLQPGYQPMDDDYYLPLCRVAGLKP